MTDRLRRVAYVRTGKPFFAIASLDDCQQATRNESFLFLNDKPDDNTWAENGYAMSVYWSDNPLTGFEPIPQPHVVLTANEHWDSPGQVCVVTDAAGNEWLIYHAVDPKDRFIAGTDRFLRKMCMDKVRYTAEGWPYLNGSSPSTGVQTGPQVLG